MFSQSTSVKTKGVKRFRGGSTCYESLIRIGLNEIFDWLSEDYLFPQTSLLHKLTGPVEVKCTHTEHVGLGYRSPRCRGFTVRLAVAVWSCSEFGLGKAESS